MVSQANIHSTFYRFVKFDRWNYGKTSNVKMYSWVTDDVNEEFFIFVTLDDAQVVEEYSRPEVNLGEAVHNGQTVVR